MIGHDLPNSDRLDDLLADRALQGLLAEEQRELEALLEDASNEEEVWEYELTVAALDEALGAADASAELLPAAVQSRLEEQAVRWLAQAKGLTLTPSPGEYRNSVSASPISERSRRGPGPWVLVAACVLLSVLGWRLIMPQQPNYDAMRAQLLNTASDVRTIEWNENDLGVRGDVVWSDARQAGFMRFEGLVNNDPTVEQYQLWIFDKDRDARYPVDGGVFDIAPGRDEAIIPIDPKIVVDEATLFAITIEKPGGVVVSDRERLILLGQAAE